MVAVVSEKTDYDARVAIENELSWLHEHGWSIDELREFCEDACDMVEEDDE